MITSHTTEPSPQELENAAEAINAMLLTDSSVTDCVTVIHSESNTPFRVYVVGNGARPDRQLRPKIEAAIAHFSKGINIAVIAVSNLPLTAAGKINIRLLSKLPVIDEETVAACKRQLQARNPDSQISVDIIARNLPKSLIHYTDLGIQSFQPLKVEDLTNAGQAPAPVIGFADSKEDYRQAITRNASLRDVKATMTLPEALLRAASSFFTRGVGYIDASKQWFFQTYSKLYEDAQSILAALQNYWNGRVITSLMILTKSSVPDGHPVYCKIDISILSPK